MLSACHKVKAAWPDACHLQAAICSAIVKCLFVGLAVQICHTLQQVAGADTFTLAMQQPLP